MATENGSPEERVKAYLLSVARAEIPPDASNKDRKGIAQRRSLAISKMSDQPTPHGRTGNNQRILERANAELAPYGLEVNLSDLKGRNNTLESQINRTRRGKNFNPYGKEIPKPRKTFQHRKPGRTRGA